ncbi:hypothetical protein A9E74_01231 [Methylophaga muralis]|uniref:Uncharacterized protein n=2 Tax=Methylophaga muralis TaxID=291169 RepID=A0A1E3GSY5_9GAMM|nr:hypothetical protein A9E74_01231 [Methylophaga muralis]
MMWIGLILLLVIAYGIYQMPEKKRLAEEQKVLLKQQNIEEAKATKERDEKRKS